MPDPLSGTGVPQQTQPSCRIPLAPSSAAIVDGTLEPRSSPDRAATVRRHILELQPAKICVAPSARTVARLASRFPGRGPKVLKMPMFTKPLTRGHGSVLRCSPSEVPAVEIGELQLLARELGHPRAPV